MKRVRLSGNIPNNQYDLFHLLKLGYFPGDSIFNPAKRGLGKSFPNEFFSKKYFYEASELLDLKDRFIPWFHFFVPYCVRYAVWTLWVTAYLAATICVSYAWNLLLRISPLWMEARVYQLKENYYHLIRWWTHQVRHNYRLI